MIIKVMTVAFMVSMGYAETSELVQYAVPLQNLHRNLEPLPLKHDTMLYQAKKTSSQSFAPAAQRHLAPESPKIYATIQYAPLPKEDLKRNNQETSKLAAPQHYDYDEDKKEKVNLSKPKEPNPNSIYEYGISTPFVQYLPNKALQPNLYYNNSNSDQQMFRFKSPDNIQQKISANYNYPPNPHYTSYQNVQKQQGIKTQQITLNHHRPTEEFTPQRKLSLYDYTKMLTGNSKLMSVLCAKAPRLHLNVARSFSNFANNPYKEHFHHQISPLINPSTNGDSRQLLYFLNRYIPLHLS